MKTMPVPRTNLFVCSCILHTSTPNTGNHFVGKWIHEKNSAESLLIRTQTWQIQKQLYLV